MSLHLPHGAMRHTFWPLLITVLVASSVTAAIFWQIRKAQLDGFRSEFDTIVSMQSALLTRRLDQCLLVTTSLGHFLAADPNIDSPAFHAFAAPFVANQKSLQALEWAPRLSAAQRALFEQQIRQSGIGNFRITDLDASGHLVPAGQRDAFYPLLYVEPLGPNKPATGFDLGSDARLRAALDQARDTGEPAVTERITLLQVPPQQSGFLVFVPVYRHGLPAGTVTERRAALAGFAVAAFETRDVISTALYASTPPRLSFKLIDSSAPARDQVLYLLESPPLPARSWRSPLFPAPPQAVRNFSFAGRRWSLEITAGPAYMDQRSPVSYWLICPADLLLSSLLALYLRAILSARGRMQRLVSDRTAALRESEARYRAVVEFSPEGICVSINDKLVYANPAAVRLANVQTVEELVGRSVLEFVHEDFRAEVMRRQTAMRQTGLSVTLMEGKLRRPDGTIIEAEWMSLPIVYDGKPAILNCFRDITDRKRAEVELRRARDELEQRVRERTAELLRANERLQELNRLKSQFIATMSHELRTPLHSIIGFTGTLRQGFAGPLTDEQKKQLDIVAASARHLLSLINDLLDLSRIEAGKMDLDRHPFNFADVVTDVVQNLAPMANRKNLRLSTHLSPPAMQMVGDRKRCFQVLLNLVNNAIKFTNRGQVEIDAQAGGGQLCVSVADTGIGIEPGQMGRLFEAFHQLDASANHPFDGAGLGLHISRKLIALMHGRITAESEPGKGSQFTFTMPLRLPVVAGR